MNGLIFLTPPLLITLRSGCCCIQCVGTQTVAVIEQCGNFNAILPAGMNFVLWPIANVAGVLSLRIQQLDVVCETKTKDNVFVQVAVSVQYRVLTEKTYDAFYRLTDPTEQIRSYVYDVIRSTVPKMELDKAFESKADIADACQDQLQKVMNDYGYEIMESLVTDLSPDVRVKASMNEINASKRLKMASMHKVRGLCGERSDLQVDFVTSGIAGCASRVYGSLAT